MQFITLALLLGLATPLYAQCAAQANFDGCIGTAESRIAMCGGTDFPCLCERTKEKVLCYDQCPENPVLQGQKASTVGLVTTYCSQAQVAQPSTTTTGNSTAPKATTTPSTTAKANDAHTIQVSTAMLMGAALLTML